VARRATGCPEFDVAEEQGDDERYDGRRDGPQIRAVHAVDERVFDADRLTEGLTGRSVTAAVDGLLRRGGYLVRFRCL